MNGRNAREIRTQYCYENFPQYWNGLGALCAVIPPVERLRQAQPFDYGRMRVHTVRELMERRGLRSCDLAQPYVMLADGANMLCGLSDYGTGHFLSAVYCQA